MDTSPKTCCYRPLTRSPLLAELMVVMGGVTTAELVRGNLAYVCTFTIRDVSVMSIPVSPKHFLSLKCTCGSVVEHCVSSAKGCGFNSQGTHILIKKCIA